MEEKTALMRSLVDQLNEAARVYYTSGESLMSDAEWDALYARLEELERETGETLPDSPTRRVGGEPLAAFKQHRHLSPLWSLDKVQTEEGLKQWFARAAALRERLVMLPPLAYAAEYKFDGLTINLTYEGGLLVHAATRGNGAVGEEILPQVRTVRGVPLRIPYQGLMEVHGECVMRLSTFDNYNKTAPEPLKNARNAAAGALRNLDPSVTASRKLDAFFYEVGTISNPPFSDLPGMIQFLRSNGFPVSPTLIVSEDAEQIVEAIRRVEQRREQLDFLIDGVVVKVSDRQTRQAFGYTDKFPRWAIAFKFAAEENTTTLEEVTWEVGRTGKLTPLAHVASVDFSGVTVRRATLNNWGDVQRKRLKLGVRVWIRRSNDVIPEIMGVVNPDAQGQNIEKPAHCPACGTALQDIGAHLVCPNRDGCRPQIIARLSHFAGRDAMDIATFSDRTAALFVDHLGVREADALYSITREQLLTLPGFLAKRADNMLEALAASKACTLDAFLFAIGIPNIGRGTARDIAAHFGTLEKVRAADAAALSGVEGVGPVVAQSILDFFLDAQNSALIDRLLAAGVHPHDAAQPGEAGKLNGQSVVVTGTLPTLSRQQAEDLIRANGGVSASAVSRKTAFLVSGEKAGSKLGKAQALGIPVYTEEQFLELLK